MIKDIKDIKYIYLNRLISFTLLNNKVKKIKLLFMYNWLKT